MRMDVFDKAKPCPMCGSKDIYLERGDTEGIFSITVGCRKCGLSGFKNFLYSAKNPEGKTLEYWNTRADENAFN